MGATRGVHLLEQPHYYNSQSIFTLEFNFYVVHSVSLKKYRVDSQLKNTHWDW